VIRQTQPADATTALEFMKKYLAKESCPMPVAYVFSRKIFNECGGFASFDSGLHSDVAAWALFGARGGIEPIENTFVRWRVTDINISPKLHRDRPRYAEGTMRFLAWLQTNRSNLALSDGDLALLADLIGWEIYGPMADAPVGDWLPTACRASKLLNSCRSGSLARHLFRFARERMRRSNSART